MTIRAAIKREERRLEKQLGSATSVEWNPFRCEGIGWVSSVLESGIFRRRRRGSS
jgi:hypothetical protein